MADRATTVTSPLRRWLLYFAATVVAVVFCSRYVDLPVAGLVDAHLTGTVLSHLIYLAFKAADLVIPLALSVLFVSGWCRVTGKPLPSWLTAPLLCSWALAWSVPATLVLKAIFGRAQPNPDYVALGRHEWDFFGGSPLRDHDSFPSGTMAVAGAVIAVLWILYPRLRWVWTAVYGLIAIGLVLVNFHFVGDVVGGAFLGLSIGWMTIRILQPTTEHG